MTHIYPNRPMPQETSKSEQSEQRENGTRDGQHGENKQSRHQQFRQSLHHAAMQATTKGAPEGGKLATSAATFTDLMRAVSNTEDEGQAKSQNGEKEGQDPRSGREPNFAMTILPGDRIAPTTDVQATKPAVRMDAQVEKVMAAVEAEIAAGRTAELTQGHRGSLTLSFPLPVPALGISGAMVKIDGNVMELVLAGTQRLPADAENALRDLARSLAARHPNKTVKVTHEADATTPAAPAEAEKPATTASGMRIL